MPDGLVTAGMELDPGIGFDHSSVEDENEPSICNHALDLPSRDDGLLSSSSQAAACRRRRRCRCGGCHGRVVAVPTGAVHCSLSIAATTCSETNRGKTECQTQYVDALKSSGIGDQQGGR